MLLPATVLDSPPAPTRTCRHCSTSLTQPVLDLGMLPTGVGGVGTRGRGELYAPLRLLFCDSCRLLQLDRVEGEQPGIQLGQPACQQPQSRSGPRGAQGAAASAQLHLELVAGEALTQPRAQDCVISLHQRLASEGVVRFEQPNMLQAVSGAHLDVFHQTRPCYPSLLWSERLLCQAGLRLFDATVDDATGMLHLFAERPGNQKCRPSARLFALRTAEQEARLDDFAGYQRLGFDANLLRHGLLECLLEARRYGGLVAAYGSASAFGQFLSYCRLGPDTIAFLVDPEAPQDGGVVAGTRIPIRTPHAVPHTRPSHLLLLPWRQRDRLVDELAYVREWGGRFIVPLPRVELFG